MKTLDAVKIERNLIKGFAQQFGVPFALAQQAWTAGEGNYTRAYEWLRDYMLSKARA